MSADAGTVEGEPNWHLRLYVVGTTPRSEMALANLRAMCAAHLGQDYRIEVIDLLLDPDSARADHVIVIPTTVRLRPGPQIQVIGDLSDRDRATKALGLPCGAPDS